MNNRLYLIAIFSVLTLALWAACTQSEAGSWTGSISDSMCGADHSMMGEDGKDPVKCTNLCVKAGEKYILVDTNGKTFTLDAQDRARPFAGRKVTIQGTLDGDSIKVSSIAAQ